MGTKQEIGIAVVADNATGERKIAIVSVESNTMLVFNMEELKALQIALVDAIAYIEKHGTHLTESVPEGAVRH